MKNPGSSKTWIFCLRIPDRALFFVCVDPLTRVADWDTGIAVLSLTTQERNGVFAVIPRCFDKFIQEVPRPFDLKVQLQYDNCATRQVICST